MDNHTAEGHQYDRQFFADPNILRQQMGLYGMHQSPLGLPGHQMSQQMFSAVAARRPQFGGSDVPEHCVGLPSSQRSNVVQSPSTLTPIPGTNSNPWMLSFSSQSAMDPEMPMNMSGLYQTRWSHQQSTVPATQSTLPTTHPTHQRDPHIFQSQFDLAVQQRENQIREAHIQQQQEHGAQIQRECEAQVQRERAAQMHREQEFQMQREQEAQMQREKENQIQRERKVQMQAERESQLLLEREAQFRKHEAQMQRERDLQMQREREAQIQHEKEAQLQREKEAKLQREREAQLQREREAQLQREHEVKIQREREAQAKREKEAQILKEKEELIKREREETMKCEKEAKLKREKEAQLQLLQRERNAQLEMDRKAQIRRDMFMQHENQFFQVNQPGHINMHHMGNLPMMHHHLNFQNQHDINSLIKKSSLPSATMSNHPFYSSQMKNSAVSSGMPTLSKPMALGSSLIHFPQSTSPANQLQDEQWVLSQNMSNILKKSSNSLDDNFLSTLDPSYRDRNVFESQYQSSQLMKNLDDIDLTIDRHISPIKIDCQDKETEKTNTFSSSLYQGFLSQSSSGITQMQENLKVTPASGSHEAVPHITFSKFSQQNAPWDQQQPNKGESSNASNSPNIAFSHSNSVKVTQSSSVNINININMPSHHGFPFQLPELTTTVCDAPKVNSANEKKKENNAEVDIAKQHVSSVSLNQQISVPQHHNSAMQQNIAAISHHPQASVPQQHVTAVSLAQEVSVSKHMSSVSLETKADFPNVTKSSEYKMNNEVSTSLPFTTETTTVLETSDCSISKIEPPLNPSLSEDMSPIIGNDVPTTAIQMESKQKQSFSSIECFLGMNTSTVDSELKFISPVTSSSSLEIARTVLEQQDRISVIKPLNEEKMESIETNEEKMETNEDQMEINDEKMKRSEDEMNLADEEIIGNLKRIEHVHEKDSTGIELQNIVEEKSNHGNHGIHGNYSRFENDQVKGSTDWPGGMHEIINNTDQFVNIDEGDSVGHFGILHKKVGSTDHFGNLNEGYSSDQLDNLRKKVGDLSKFGKIQQHGDYTTQFVNIHQEDTSTHQLGSLRGKGGNAEQSANLHGKVVETEKFGTLDNKGCNKEHLRNLHKKGSNTVQYEDLHRKVGNAENFGTLDAKVGSTDHLGKLHQKGGNTEQFGNLHVKVESAENFGTIDVKVGNTEHLGKPHQKGGNTEQFGNIHVKVDNMEQLGNLSEKGDSTEILERVHDKLMNARLLENVNKNIVHIGLPENLHDKLVNTNVNENIEEKVSYSDCHKKVEVMNTVWSKTTQKKDDAIENVEIQYEKGGNHIQSGTKLKSSVVAPVHPSMRFKCTKVSSSQSNKADAENADIRLMHPSMRLRRNSLKSPTSGPEEDSLIKLHTPEKIEPLKQSKQQEKHLLQQHQEQKQQDKYQEQPPQQQQQKHCQKQYHEEQKQHQDQPEIHYHLKQQHKQKHWHPEKQTQEQQKQHQQQQEQEQHYHNEEQQQQEQRECQHQLKQQQQVHYKQSNQLQQKQTLLQEKHHPLQQQEQPQMQQQVQKQQQQQQERHHRLQQQSQQQPQQQQQQDPQHHQKQKQKQQQQQPQQKFELQHHQQKEDQQQQQHPHPQQQQQQQQQRRRRRQQRRQQQQQQKQQQKQSSDEISGASVSHEISDLPVKEKPITAEKPVKAEIPANISISTSKPVTPEKHVNIPTSKSINHSLHGGKPASYNASLTEHAKSAPSGKPLSYLQSIADANKAEAFAKHPSSGNTVRKKRDISTAKTVTRKSRVRPTKSLLNEIEQKVENDEVEQHVSSPVQKSVKNKPMSVQYNHDRVKESCNQAVAPTENVPSNSNKQDSKSVLTSEKAFTFNKITFDGKETKESSGSDTDSSSESEDEEKQESGDDSSSKTESGSDDDDDDDANDDDDDDDDDDEEEDEDDGEQGAELSQSSHTDSALSQDSEATGRKRKEMADSAEVIANLKKRKFVDEALIKIPLNSGWQRQTRLRPTTSGEGLRGDVYYYSPCGKKLRTYPELNHYITKNNIDGIELRHFSFSTKLRVGDFLEARQGSKFEILSEEQVKARFDNMSQKTRQSQERAKERRDKKKQMVVKARLAQEEVQRKKVEIQALKKQKEDERRKAIQDKALESKLRKEQEREAAKEAKHIREMAVMSKKLEKKTALEAERIAKRERVQSMIEEKRRAKEFKEKERLMKLENQRLEKEWKQQAIENERERKRQMMVMNKAQEKEKRRRELVMMKAYESQRRAEERERLKEQKKLEKTLVRQRKLEQKRYEKLISRELKKPIDDMALKDMKPLPDVPLVANLNIPGKAYADLLMVEEFIYSFGHVIDIDPEEDFPSMADLQASLLCESLSEDALYNACQSLLFYALYDPGVTGKHATTQLGVNLQNVELNETNISEMLRLFILARNEGANHLLSDLLEDKPLVSLSPNNKAAVLAYLCNELLCGKSIGREIEANLDNMSNLRRDKWTLEGEIRKLKADISKKKPKNNDNEGNKKCGIPTSSGQGNEDEEIQGDDEKDSNDEKYSDDDANQTFTGSQGFSESQEEIDEDADTSIFSERDGEEEMKKKLKLMEKRHSRYRKKLFDASHTIRGIHLGQDRYKRRYFILPNGGGIYVEGLESGYYDEEICTKTEEQKEKKKEHIGSLLTSIKGTKSSDSTPLRLLPGYSPGRTSESFTPGRSTGNCSPVCSTGSFPPGRSHIPGRSLPGPTLISPTNRIPSKETSFFSPVEYKDNDIVKIDTSNIKHEPLSPSSKNRTHSSPSYGLSSSSCTMNSSQGRSFSSYASDTRDEKITSNRLSSSYASNAYLAEKSSVCSPNFTSEYSTTHTTPYQTATTPLVKKSSTKWFSLSSKEKCEDIKPIIKPPQQTINKKYIIAPYVELLSQDHRFLESSYNPFFYKNNAPNTSFEFGSPMLCHQNLNNMHSTPRIVNNSTSLLGLPPGLDINLLIQQDPQKAAELLEIQLSVPQDVPKEKQHAWWRITDPEQLQRIIKVAHPRGMRERLLQKTVTRNMDYAINSCKTDNYSFSLVLPNDEGETKEEIKQPAPKTLFPIVDHWYPQLAYASDKAILIEVEELEEKVFSASLQVKGCRLSQKISPTLHLDVSKGYNPKGDEHPINAAKSRLLALEAGIERRYLKHPFRLEKMSVGTCKSESTEPTKDEALMNANIQEITPALRLWKEAVAGAKSSAQLSMCIHLLNECVAWDKSIMKVFCILCRKSDNEERLLLCDMCDRGCHTYCCKPKLEEIPEGDWFCQECILMASGSDQCYACKGKSGKRLKCAFCPRHYHMQCLDPPLQKAPRSPWACPVCKKARSKTKAPARKKPRVEDLIKQEETNKAKLNNRQHLHKHLETCREILVELENHEYGWPYLVPVNSKQFPEYYKIIKHSMDFHTMKTKLRDYVYKTRDEFASDARLVFTNCNIFNEDDSEVGRAGKIMSSFFETRWTEILANEEKKTLEEKTPEKILDTKPDKKEKLNTSIIEKRESSSSGEEEDEESSSSDEISSESESSEVEDCSDGQDEEHQSQRNRLKI